MEDRCLKVNLLTMSGICLPLFIIFVYGCASMPVRPPAQERIKIAVVGMGNDLIDQKVADMLSTAFSKSGYFTVIDQESIHRVMEEQRFQFSGFVDPQTAVKLRKLLGVQMIMKGDVRFGWQILSMSAENILVYSITATIWAISTETGKTIAHVSESGRSYAGGVPATVTSGGKTRQDFLGVKKSDEDMFNTAVRKGIDKATISLIKAIYGKDRIKNTR